MRQNGTATSNGNGNGHGPGGLMLERENIAWLARTSQAPQPSIQSQTNGMMDRCHGCGVMTGEWMQGPDGPGSLCVSCGVSLHLMFSVVRTVGKSRRERLMTSYTMPSWREEERRQKWQSHPKHQRHQIHWSCETSGMQRLQATHAICVLTRHF